METALVLDSGLAIFLDAFGLAPPWGGGGAQL